MRCSIQHFISLTYFCWVGDGPKHSLNVNSQETVHKFIHIGCLLFVGRFCCLVFYQHFLLTVQHLNLILYICMAFANVFLRGYPTFEVILSLILVHYLRVEWWVLCIAVCHSIYLPWCSQWWNRSANNASWTSSYIYVYASPFMTFARVEELGHTWLSSHGPLLTGGSHRAVNFLHVQLMPGAVGAVWAFPAQSCLLASVGWPSYPRRTGWTSAASLQGCWVSVETDSQKRKSRYSGRLKTKAGWLETEDSD